MIDYIVELTPNSYWTLKGWVDKWSQILSVEGTTILSAAFRNPQTIYSADYNEIRMWVLGARTALAKFEIKKSTAKLDLTGLTDRQCFDLLWVMAHARTGHGSQHEAYERTNAVVSRFLKRSPLIKLAECAL